MKPNSPHAPAERGPLIKLLRLQFRLDRLQGGLAELGIEGDVFHVDLLSTVQELMGFQPDPDAALSAWEKTVTHGSDDEILAFLRELERQSKTPGPPPDPGNN